jgi:hypothetical protein
MTKNASAATSVAPAVFAFLTSLAAVTAWAGEPQSPASAKPETVIVTSQEQPSDPCVNVANAKYLQWQQPRVLLSRTQVFEKGAIAHDEIIVTPNTGYERHRGIWSTANLTIPERNAPSPEAMLVRMGLGECTAEGQDQLSSQPATRYSYSYKPDRAGFLAHGAMWISNATGLPLKQDLNESAPPANRLVAVSESTTYVYNSDVQIPLPAELAESKRLYGAASALGHAQATPASGMAGGN